MSNLGDVINALGVRADSLQDDDLVAGAVVLLKVVESDGSVRLVATWSEGMSWLERSGMLRHAETDELGD